MGRRGGSVSDDGEVGLSGAESDKEYDKDLSACKQVLE